MGRALATWFLVAACGGGDGRPAAPDAAVPVDAAPDAPVDAAPDAPGDLLARLRAVDGLTVEELPAAGGRRFFHLGIDQPEAHAAPGGRRFTQRLTLLHAGEGAPVVLSATGYDAPRAPLVDEVTALLGASQLSIEHRFFGASRAEPPDWTTLTVAEAAADFHRAVALLRPVLGGRWISTGGSKGGVAVIAHRRFHPADVDGTVALATPLSTAAPDPRYPLFVAAAGGPAAAACRDDLVRFQRLALSRRDAVQARMRLLPLHFEVLGLDKALEDAVLELPFLFWMNQEPGLCALVPDDGASDDEVFLFLDDVAILANFSDERLGPLEAYYHQGATQLGWPAHDERAVADLLRLPGGDRGPSYVPHLPASYDGGAAVSDLAAWVRREGSRLLLVYGGDDPWTAGAIDLGDAVDSARFIVAGENHHVRLADLPEPERAAAVAMIRRWAE
jgi:hypothetical protein